MATMYDKLVFHSRQVLGIIRMRRSVRTSTTTSGSTGTPLFQLVSAQTAFKTKSTFELLRALLVFRFCTLHFFVANAKEILAVSDRLLGRKLTSLGIKHTFFEHFCAGEDAVSIQPTLTKLRKAGIGGILDFAAESDLATEPGIRPSSGARANRPTDKAAAESSLDRNLEVTIRAIEAAASVGGSAAVKVCALWPSGALLLQERSSHVSFPFSSHLLRPPSCSGMYPTCCMITGAPTDASTSTSTPARMLTSRSRLNACAACLSDRRSPSHKSETSSALLTTRETVVSTFYSGATSCHCCDSVATKVLQRQHSSAGSSVLKASSLFSPLAPPSH